MEEWKDVVGYEGRYMVSSIGRVKSLISPGTGAMPRKKAKYLKGALRFGYTVVHLSKNYKIKVYPVHRLMIDTFLKPEGEYVTRHLDGCRSNNVISNLAPGTHQENMDDMVRHGAAAKGERNGSCKLKREDVLEIRRLYSKGDITMMKLGTMFNVTRANIGYIVNRKKWAWLKEESK